MTLVYAGPPLLAALLMLAQSVPSAATLAHRFVPDLSLVVVVFFGWRNGRISATISGFVAGLTADIASGAPLGMNAFAGTVIGFLSGFSHHRIAGDPVLMPAALVSLAFALRHVTVLLIIALYGIDGSAQSVFEWFGLRILTTVVASPVLFAVLRRVHSFHVPRRIGEL